MTSSPDHQCESPRSYDFVVLDGGNLIHSLSVGSMKGRSFGDFFSKVFLPRIIHECEAASRVDVVFDRYLPMSIKSAQEKGEVKVLDNVGQVQPREPFLLNSNNKSQLFNFLANKYVKYVSFTEIS